MTHGILIQNKAKAKDVSSLNRSVICNDAVENGWVMSVDSLYKDGGDNEVWLAEVPAAGSQVGLWMAYAPEIVLTNAKYKGMDPDPRSFINSASQVFDAFRLEVGDIITLTDEALAGASTAKGFAVSGSTYQLEWASVPSGSLTSLKLLEGTYVSIGTGAIGSQRVPAHKFEVIVN